MGYLFATDSGKRLRARAGSMISNGYNRARDYVASRKDVADIVQERAERGELPDTPMAQAFAVISAVQANGKKDRSQRHVSFSAGSSNRIDMLDS